jgi:hypothetical protein
MQNILNSPPAPRGRPSFRYLAERAERRRLRDAQANLNENENVTAQATAIATQTAPFATANASATANATTNATATATATITATLPVRHPNRYHTYSLAFKLHVIEYSQSHSIRAAQDSSWMDSARR